MRWAAALSTASHLGDAVNEASEAARQDLQGDDADVVFAFVSANHSSHYEQLPGYLRAAFPRAQILGCSAGGVIGAGQEVEGEPALSLVVAHLPGVEARCVHLGPDPASWQPVLERDHPGELVVLADPISCDASELIAWLDREHPESAKIGGLASGSMDLGEHALFSTEGTHRSGAVVLALTGNIEVDTIVAQGCRPIGQPLFVTRADRNLIYELDGRPALTALEQTHAELPPEDQELFRQGLQLGVVMREACEVYEHGDYLIRNLLGADAKTGTLAVDAAPRTGQVVQFHLRDSHSSADDLSELLSRHQYAAPAGALLFSCMGRGKDFYGAPNHDSEMFANYLGPVPMGGFFGNGEIGPVQGTTYLHGYTSSFGLFRPKQR